MRTTSSIPKTIIMVCMLAFSGAGPVAGQLRPANVLVVANEKSPESVNLARTYMQLRGIPADNLATVKTTTGYHVGRESYDSQIAGPLRELLAGTPLGERIRCIALMWGVPVRVLEPKQPSLTPVEQAYRMHAEKALYSAVIAHKLLGTVAVDFPAPRTKTLKPLGDLFDATVTPPEPPLPDFADVKLQVMQLIAEKTRDIPRIADPANRKTAWRQLMAVTLDIEGLRGLKSLVERHSPPTAPDAAYLGKLLLVATSKLTGLQSAEEDEQNVAARLDVIGTIGGVLAVYEYADPRSGAAAPLEGKRDSFLDKTLASADASVDSELALLLWDDYKLEGWIENPLSFRRRSASRPDSKPVLLTARIDGPTAADALRIIKDSVAAEARGLKGTFYIDAGSDRSPAYDKNLLQLFQLVRANTSLKVVCDEQPGVFRQGKCPDAALYVGWYSLKQYVPAFTWVPGSFGWHIASFEAMDLRNPESQTWCVKMIQNGVAGTIGAVAEPLLGSFPLPQDFYGLLLTGDSTLAECYWLTVPCASWRLTLIGDPLYKPFTVDPAMKASMSVSPAMGP
jgi:uncharacterized protein (TIGR03790 family)